MAESQVQYTYQNSGADVRSDLSEERFKPYLVKAGHKTEYAFNLYLYNARLSKAFLFPLHILEVTLRNRINQIFCREYESDWPLSVDFRAELTQESRDALDVGIRRANSNRTEDIVATLSFDFWSNLFRPEYDRAFWQSNMKDLLPNNVMLRSKFQNHVRVLNKFRNRIAHHEPIHTSDVSGFHKEILDVISWLSAETYQWVKHYSTVNTIIRTRPSANGEAKPHFSERCDDDFSIFQSSTSLCDLDSERFFICVGDDGQPISVIEQQQISNYLLSFVEERSLVLDLDDHTLDDVIGHQDCSSNYSLCGASESYSKSSILLKKKVQYLVIQDDQEVIGVIAKAHRRY